MVPRIHGWRLYVCTTSSLTWQLSGPQEMTKDITPKTTLEVKGSQGSYILGDFFNVPYPQSQLPYL